MKIAMRVFEFFQRRPGRLGVATEKRRYDLPLNKDAGTGFLLLLVALMTFLAIMALGCGLALGGLAAQWSSGLQNKMTIEIPAKRPGGGLRNDGEFADITRRVEELLKKNPDVVDHKILSKEEIRTLIEPWIGGEASLDNIPLPRLISLTMKSSDPEDVGDLQDDLRNVAMNINLDTHEEWLSDVIKLTGTLQFAAMIVVMIIIATTITAVAGAVRSRMAVHRADVELLHLMGATDTYISRQFQRHALIMGLKGSLGGVIASLLVIGLISILIGHDPAATLPSVALGGSFLLCLLMTPALACLIAGGTARLTVLHALSQMP